MRLFYLSVIFYLSSININFAQQNTTIKAHVYDATNQEPIPFAHLYLARWHIGTTTSQNGYFELTLPEHLLEDSIQISSIGYATLKVTGKSILAGQSNLYLKEDIKELSTITVSAEKLDVKDIVKKASEQFYKYYRSAPSLAKFHYYESKKKNGVFEGETSGVGEFYQHGLSEEGKKNKYYLKSYGRNVFYFDQIRRTDYNWNYNDWYKYLPKGKWNRRHYEREQSRDKYLATTQMLLYKDHLLYFGPLSNKKFQFFNYKLSDITTYNNQLVYVVRFVTKSSKNKIRGNGYLYITADDYTVLSIKAEDFKYESVNLITGKNTLEYYPDNLLRLHTTSTIDFAFFNNELFFHHLAYNIDYLNPIDTISRYNELQLSNLSSRESLTPVRDVEFKANNIIGYTSLFSSYPLVTYNKAFWDEYELANPDKNSLAISSYDTVSLYEKRFGKEEYYINYLGIKVYTSSQFQTYEYLREVLHESAYGSLIITESNNDSINTALNNVAFGRSTLKNKNVRKQVDIRALSKVEQDSINYQNTLLRQVDTISAILGESCATMFDSISYYQFLAIRDRELKKLADTLENHKPFLSERYYYRTKGTQIGLWLEMNLLITEYKTDTVRLYDSLLLKSALKKFQLNDPNYFSSEEFSSYILEIISVHLKLLEKIPNKQLLSESYAFISNEFDDPLKELLLGKLLKQDVLAKGFQEHYIQFIKTYPKSSYLSEFEEMINARKDIRQKGDAFPEISVFTKDSVSQTINLSNKRLAVVDIWYMGCKPCVEALKFTYPKLIDKYKNNVTFIFLSRDSDFDRWKAFIEKNHLKGNHFFIQPPKVDMTLMQLNVRFYPAQFMIEDGIIVSELTSGDDFFDELELVVR